MNMNVAIWAIILVLLLAATAVMAWRWLRPKWQRLVWTQQSISQDQQHILETQKRIERNLQEFKPKEYMEVLDALTNRFDGLQDRVNNLGRDTALMGRLVDELMTQNTEVPLTSAPSREPVDTIAAQIASGSSPTILVAGMRQSGSTALFNIVRFMFEAKGIDIDTGYSEGEDFIELPSTAHRPRLIKTHELREDLIASASFIFTTRRDLRNTVASAARREFYLLKALLGPVNYANYNRRLHDQWRIHSQFEFVYEAFVTDESATIDQIFRTLGFDDIDIDQIRRKVHNIPQDQYDQTLLSPTHITDPEQKLTFEDTLKPSVVQTIEAHNHAWLARFGYNLSTPGAGQPSPEGPV